MGTVPNNANLSSFHEDHIDIVHSTLKDIRSSVQQQSNKPLHVPVNQQAHDDEKKMQTTTATSTTASAAAAATKSDRNSPIWLPRHHHNQHNQSRESLNSDHNASKPLSIDDEEADTDLETDRLLGQQRLDDHGFYDDKVEFCFLSNFIDSLQLHCESIVVFCHFSRRIGVIVHLV